MSRKKENKPIELTGKIDITKSGLGYVNVEGLDEDVIVKPYNLGLAFNGDTVTIRIKNTKGKNRTEGAVTGIVERKHAKFMGKIQVVEKGAFFIPEGNDALPDFFIRKENLGSAKDGDYVVAKFLDWNDKHRNPEATVVNVLDMKNRVDWAMKGIIIDQGFSILFPEKVVDDANKIDGSITEEERANRRDCRDLTTMTIDPTDAKDFDDALSIDFLDNNLIEVGVHIADVTHFVTPGSDLDKEAYERATSVYLPDRVVPMLPEKISNELCSLRPDEDKYCFSAIFKFDKAYKIIDFWVGKSIIRSKKRFNYDEVQQIIETGQGEFLKEIQTLNEVAKSLRSERFKKGAINFSGTEVKFKLNEESMPIGIILKESKESHHLIEEFMLLANREVATYVSKIKVHEQKLPFPYRIHDVPDEEKLKMFIPFARKFGYKFDISSSAAIVSSFNRMLNDVKGRPEQTVIEQLGVRTMAKAEYSPNNIGHFGLGFPFYCHFTSPIRRYPDMMVHRILFDVLQKKPSIDKDMEQHCYHCSERERAAIEAERDGDKYEQVLYMKDRVGEELDGVISGVASFGFWVETVNEKCEGLVSIKDLLLYDDFKHVETEYSLVGSRTGRKFQMGDPVRVKLVAANLDKSQLDFEWVPFSGQTLKKNPAKMTTRKDKFKKSISKKRKTKRK